MVMKTLPDGSQYSEPPYTDAENARFLAGFLSVAEGRTQLTTVSVRPRPEEPAVAPEPLPHRR